jgi:hypothetical protein
MKYIFLTTVLMTLLLQSSEEKVENKYLYFSNGSLSNIDISCKKDDDCMLTRSLQMGCSHFIAVNKKLTQKGIEAFNAKEGIFWITKDVECSYASEKQLKMFTPKCLDKVCGMSNGKVTYVQPPPACGMDEELRRLSEKKKPISTAEYKKRLEQRLPECTPRLIEQHIKKEMKRYGIERKLTSPPPCLTILKDLE